MNILNYRSFVLVMVIAIFFGIVVLIVNSRDESKQQIESDSIISSMQTLKVVGYGTVSVTPDIANLRINVVSQQINAIQAREQAAQSMQALMQVFKKFNIADKDLRTSGYSLYPEYLYEKNKIKRIEAFNVSNNLDVIIRNLDELGAVIDAAITVDSKDIRIDNISFSIDNDKSFKEQARKNAVKDAYSVAEQIIDVTNQNLGNPLEITDLAYTPYNGPIGISRAMMSEKGFTSTPISPGQIVIESKVEIIFAMQ